jgi:chemotaxis methyl-accepting protein methylase
MPEDAEMGMVAEQESMQAFSAQEVDALHRAGGLEVGWYDPEFLARTASSRIAATSLAGPAAYLERLTADPEEVEVLRRSLRVNYSEFCRDPLAFAVLEQVVLPDLFARQGGCRPAELRVWSAGCATGQEAWSIAVVLDQAVSVRDSQTGYRVIATDLSEEDLTVARRGVYDTAAVRNLRLSQLEACFDRQGDFFSVGARLRDRVEFSVHDLLDQRVTGPPAGIFGDFDLILCCNLLFYYGPKARRAILDRLRQCLAPRGYLITSATERSIVTSAGGFRAISPPAAVFQVVEGGRSWASRT